MHFFRTGGGGGGGDLKYETATKWLLWPTSSSRMLGFLFSLGNVNDIIAFPMPRMSRNPNVKFFTSEAS